MKLVDAIASAVAREGATVAFNVPDEVTMHVAQALRERGIRVVRPRHEQNAVAMADGFARATDGPAVCVQGPGPALAQTGTGLVNAQRRGSPVLLLLGEVPDGRGNIKEFDNRRFVEATGVRYLEIRSVTTAAEDIHEAFRLVRLRRGPVVLNVSHVGMLEAEVPGAWRYVPAPDVPTDRIEVDLDSAAIDEAAGLLAAARRPVLIAGRGAVSAGAREEMTSLADRIGALLATSIQARGYFLGHPREIGVIGGFATEATAKLLSESDCIVAVGIGLNTYQTGGGPLAPSARLIQIDQQATRIGEFAPVDVAIIADARGTVRAIDKALERAGISDRARSWTQADQNTTVKAEGGTTAEVPRSGALPLSRALAELDKILPSDRNVVLDGGACSAFVIDGITIADPSSWFWPIEFGSIGLGLGIGIGVALANPDRECVLFAGDGALSMSIQELETAVRERVRLTIVVLNDGAYGSEVRQMQFWRKQGEIAVFRDVDFAGVARAFGADAATVRTLEDYSSLWNALTQERDGPFVIDVKVEGYEDHRSLRPGEFFPAAG